MEVPGTSSTRTPPQGGGGRPDRRLRRTTWLTLVAIETFALTASLLAPAAILAKKPSPEPTQPAPTEQPADPTPAPPAEQPVVTPVPEVTPAPVPPTEEPIASPSDPTAQPTAEAPPAEEPTAQGVDPDAAEPVAPAVGPAHAEEPIPALAPTADVSRALLTLLASGTVITAVDDAGADDEPGQKDLNALAVDYGLPGATTIHVEWNWDDTATSGNNTRDGGALFDTDGDGFANYSFYVTVASDGTWVTQLYGCSQDAKADRCTGPSLVSTYSSSATVSTVEGVDPFGVPGSDYYDPAHVTGNTCDARPDCYTDDTVAVTDIVLADFAGADATLINVCSYPSGEPNSDPSDCVFEPNSGFLTIEKIADPDNSTDFVFNASAPSAGDVSSWTITGSNAVSLISYRPTTTLDLSEVVPQDWQLDSASCEVQTATPTPTGTGSATGVDNLEIRSGLETKCTFTDSLMQGTLTLVKVVDNLGESGAGYLGVSDFPLTIDGDSATSGSPKTVLVGDHAIAETSQPGYTVGTWTCDGVAVGDAGDTSATASVGAGEDVTCTITNTLIADPALDIVKSGTFNDESGDGFAQVGETISYTFTVTNTGNVTLYNVTVTDPLVSVTGGPLASLAPGASDTTTFTASYVVTQADIDAGKVDNTATVAGDCAVDAEAPCATDTDDETVSLPQNPALDIVKSGTFNDESGDGFAQVGETISYTFTVTNTGNVTLYNVTVTDPLVSVTGGPLASLAPGASDTTTFTASYVVTQADIDAGKVDNTATVAGDCAVDAEAPCATDTDDETVSLPQNPALDIVKSGTFNDESGDGFAQVGETISYTFTVTNTGNVTLYNVTVTDPLVSVTGGPLASLAPGASDTTTFTASYVVTQADIDAGKVDNTATVAGDCAVDAEAPCATDTDDETVSLPQNPALDIVKSGTFNDESGDGFAQVGETISYTFTVTNTGNVTLYNVTVTDPLVSVTGGPLASLAPGASDTTTFTASYVVTQADIDAGKVDNTATVAGDCAVDAEAPCATDTDDETVSLPQNPALDIVKSGTFNDESGDGFAQVGETISYTFTVTNTGNVTLYNVTVTDPLVSVTGGPLASLAPGASDTTTFTASYVVTQADIDAGKVDNTATVAGDCAVDAEAPCATDTDDETVSLPQNPALDIVKSGTFNDESGDGFAQVGETISYTFTVTNTGNVTLYNVTVTDPLVSVTGGPLASLAPGASDTTTFTASYVVTQADIDAGKVDNTATVAGDCAVDAEAPCATDTDDETVSLPQNPALDIVKSGTFNDESGDGFAQVGETISYTFTVTNTGNVTLYNVTVTDPLVSVTGGPLASLAPGASDTTTFTASYVVTQADIDAGKVDNTATVAGDCAVDAEAPCATDTDDETVSLPQNPALDIVKSGTFNDESGDGFAQVGETISYTFTVTNTGNVTLYNVTVTDPLVSVTGGPLASLAPGASDTTTFTASYVVTQADIDAGKVDNTATVAGDCAVDAEAPCATDTDDETVSLPQNPALDIVKSGTFNDESGDGFAQVGETISYTFTVTNTGNVTLYNVTVTDPLVSVTGGPLASLAPGASDTTTFTASYVVTQADIDAGKVDNTATVAGDCAVDAEAPCATDTDDETVSLPQNPALDIVKTADPTTYDSTGDVISYSFLLTNSGNVTLVAPFTITDDKATDEACPATPTSLAPGESITCTASYTITSADMTVFSVTNTATGHGYFGEDPVDSNEDSETVYRQTGALLPTQTTCQEYAAGPSAWPAMYDAFLYQVKANKISSVSPGVIFYYNTIVAPSATFTLNVVETNSLNWKPMLIQDLGQAILFDANCSKASGVVVTTTEDPYRVTFTVTDATPGAIYYIGIKYSPQNLIGQPVSKSGGVYPTSIYSWLTTGYIGSGASIPVAPKK